MTDRRTNIRDALYEVPGPKTRAVTRIATAVTLAVIAVVVFLVIRQFYITGQLDARYWSIFTLPEHWERRRPPGRSVLPWPF